MKSLIYVAFLLFGMLVGTELHGQITFENLLSRYDREDKSDSAYLLLDKYEKIYRSNHQWDSLVYLMHQKGNIYFRYKSVGDVKKVIDETEIIAKKYISEDNLIYLKFLGFKSDFKQDIGDYKASEEILNKIIEIASSFEKDTTGIVEDAKAEKAFLLLNLGRVKESEELASGAYKGILARGDSSQLVSVLQSLTLANQWLNNYDKAIAYNTMNLEIIKIRNGEMHPNVGLMLNQMASIYGDMGQSKKAIEFFNKSKEISLYNYRKSGSSRFLSNTIANLGNYYSTIGEYRLAIDHMSYSLDLEIAEYGENNWRNMWHYQVLATTSRLYGDFDQADYFIDKAFKLIAENDESTPYDYNLFLARKAEMLYSREMHDKALPLALEVYDFYEQNEVYGSTNDRLHILNLITDIYSRSGALEEAEKWSIKNLQYHKENFAPMNSIRVNVLCSYLALLTKRMDSTQAYKTKEEILKLRNKGNGVFTLSNCIPEHELLIFAANWVGFLIKMSSHDEKYKEEYFDFLREFETYYSIHLSTVKTNSNLASNEQYIKRIYSPAILFLSDSDPESALLLTEKCKRFSTRQILQSQLIDDENLPSLDYMIDNTPDETNDSISVDLFFDIVSSLDSVAIYKDSLFKMDKTKYEKYFGLRELKLQDIRKIIDGNELLVEYFVFDSLVFTFYVDQSSVRCRSFSSSSIYNLAAKVLESSDVDSGKMLRSTLLPDDIISGYEKLKILPDGILNSISFEQLYFKNKPLIYSSQISYGLSASVLLYQAKLTQKKRNKNQFLGLTPGFTKELKSKMETKYTDSDSGFYYLLQQPFLLNLSESLSRDFEGETFQESRATESVFKSQAHDFRILHIGTHGILNNDSPLFSKLIFAKDSLEDGYLHAYELYGSNLNADLAVLSACSSGKEKSYASEGIVSLSHAFTHAGCPSVLMTKWDVDEKSTSAILELFYANLKNGHSKSSALREAKLSFLEQAPEELHDPYYWAGLVLIGDDSALFPVPWYSSMMGMILIAFLLGGLLYFGWKFLKRN